MSCKACEYPKDAILARLMMGEFGLDEFGKRLDRANE